MKKLLTFVVVALLAVNAYAQTITDGIIPEGFYHIKNVGTGRYMSFNDTDPSNYPVSESGSVNLNGICTYINYDSVAVSPSCVIYFKNLGNGKYDLVTQGSGFYNMTKFPIEIAGSGIYKVFGTYKGFTKYLTDMSPSNKDAHLINTETGMDNWTFEPINTSNEYIGIRPDVKTADGSYYATIFAGYNFRFVSPGMVAYYVNSAGGSEFTMKQITSDVIPAGVPVIVKCNSANPIDNKIEPVVGDYTFDEVNLLNGVYCSIYVAGHHNVTRFDDIKMRILGLSDKGELAFVANPPIDRLYKEQYLMANKAYLIVGANDADVMKVSISPNAPKCATPEISWADGKLSFNCETEGATCFYTITSDDFKSGYDNNVQLCMKYKVSVYAIKAGYDKSEVTTREIVITDSGKAIIVGDMNGDGKVNVVDHVELSKIIMGQGK